MTWYVSSMVYNVKRRHQGKPRWHADEGAEKRSRKTERLSKPHTIHQDMYGYISYRDQARYYYKGNAGISKRQKDHVLILSTT